MADRLRQAWPELQCELHPVTTQGDRTLDKPLPQIGGKGLFTQELEDALRAGAIDLAVHSLKDLPVEDAPGLALGAVLARADTRDVLVARWAGHLATLPPGAVVGTSSVRRQAQLLALRPDLQVRSIRGNVDTRIRKVLQGEYDAAVLAGAGLARLGLTDHIVEWLPPEVMLPAPGQGALAVQCRADDAAVLALLAALDEPAVRGATTAERTFLAALGGGCSAPIAASAHWLESDAGGWQLAGLVATPDGRRVVRVSGSGADAAALGQRLAAEALGGGCSRNHCRVSEIIKRKCESVPSKDRCRASGCWSPGRRPRPTTWRRDLVALGPRPVLVPTIRVVPRADLSALDRALAELAVYDWIVFTSQNAVDIVLGRCAQQGIRIANGPRIAAVGPKTAAAPAPPGADGRSRARPGDRRGGRPGVGRRGRRPHPAPTRRRRPA